jgi:transposase-like protein
MGYRCGCGAWPRAGHWPDPWGRTLITRVGKLELRVPQDRDGRFSTELFERYQHSGRALAEMSVQGVSTRRVKAITEELCGHSFSASSLPSGPAFGRTVRILLNAESCLRLIRALCVETHENWLETHRYLNMDYLRELKKEALRKAA